MKSLLEIYEGIQKVAGDVRPAPAVPTAAPRGQEKESMDKVAAEMDAAGRIMARGFADEIEKIAMRVPPKAAMLRALGRGGAIGGLGLLGMGAMATQDDELMDSLGGRTGGSDPVQDARLRKALRSQGERRMLEQQAFEDAVGSLGQISSRMPEPSPEMSVAPEEWLRSLRAPQPAPRLAPQTSFPVGPE